MTGLVLELQSDALDKSVPIDDLLRKAYVVSKKLDLADMQQWIESELQGYDSPEGCPDYRQFHGQVKVRNPFHGWQPVFIGDRALHDAVSVRATCQSIGELQDLLRNDSSTMQSGFLPQQQAALMKLTGADLEFALVFPRQSVVKVINSVRNKILLWSLDLERRKILGEGMTFSKEEKVTASQIFNTTNNIGAMHNSQIQQHSSGTQSLSNELSTNARAFADALAENLKKLGMSGEKMKEMQAEIDTLRTQIESPKPKTGIVRECLLSIKTILEGCAGNVLAGGLTTQALTLLSNLAG